MVKLQMENGYYLFKLDNILKERNISINKLMRDTNTDFKVLKRMMTGELVRFDIFVMSRLCNYFDCSLTDIIEYFPNKNRDLETYTPNPVFLLLSWYTNYNFCTFSNFAFNINASTIFIQNFLCN